jgi:hypothetical protein
LILQTWPNYLLSPTNITWSITGASTASQYGPYTGPLSVAPYVQYTTLVSFTGTSDMLTATASNTYPGQYNSVVFLASAQYSGGTNNLRVCVKSAGGVVTSQLFATPATSGTYAWFTLRFTAPSGAYSTYQIILGGTSTTPGGAAGSQTAGAIELAYFSVVGADPSTIQDGDLVLPNGVFYAGTGSIQNLAASVLTGGTGSFQTVVANVHTGGTGSFSNLAASASTSLQGVTCTTLSASGASTLAAVGCTTLTASGTGAFGPVACTTLTTSAGSTLQGVGCTTLSVFGVSSLAGVTCATLAATGTGTFGGPLSCAALTASGAASLQAATCTTLTASGTGTFGPVACTTLSASGAATCTTLTASGTGTFGPVACTTLTTSAGSTLQGVGCNTLSVFGVSSLAGVTCATLAATGTGTFGGPLSCAALTASGAASLQAATCTTLSASSQITAAYAVNILAYGTPTLYNTTPSVVATATAGGTYFLKWGSFANNHWSQTFSNTVQLQIPFSGLYAISFTLGGTTASTGEMFITRNQPLASTQVDSPANTLALQAWTSSFSLDASCSATTYLVTSDVLNFGFIWISGTVTLGSRCTCQVTLIQRGA